MRCGSRTRHTFKAAVSRRNPELWRPSSRRLDPPARDRPGPAAAAPQAHCSRRPRLGSARCGGPHDDDRHCRWRHYDHADPAAHGCEPAAPISQRHASATREPDDRIRTSGPYAGDEYFGDASIVPNAGAGRSLCDEGTRPVTPPRRSSSRGRACQPAASRAADRAAKEP